MFLGKKLLMVPQAGQYEQLCNAVAASKFGVSVLKTINNNCLDILSQWCNQGRSIKIDFPDNAERLVNEALTKLAA